MTLRDINCFLHVNVLYLKSLLVSLYINSRDVSSGRLLVYIMTLNHFRYGENGTISLAGLKRLLENVGLDRIRNVMVQHHEQAGHHAHHHYQHHHHHHHEDPHQNHPHDDSHHHKHVHAEPSPAKKFPKSPEAAKDQDIHDGLDDKKTAAQEVGATAAYSAQLVVKPEVNKSQDGSTETANLVVSRESRHVHDHDHDEHEREHQDLPDNDSVDSTEVGHKRLTSSCEFQYQMYKKTGTF